MAFLRIDLLGGFDLRLASGLALRLPTRKSRSLLAYLAMAPGRAQARAALMGLLWSNRAESQARVSLRQELHALRQGLAGIDPPVLRATADAVALDATAVEVDALVFERLAGGGARDALERAAALYRGDLLAGLTVRDPVFDDWLSFERRRLRDLATGVLGKLLALQMEGADPPEAATTARRLLALDPAHEEAHRALMRLFARRGERNAALRQYQLCQAVLARELGVEPEEETKELHRELLRRTVNGAFAELLVDSTRPEPASGDPVEVPELARGEIRPPPIEAAPIPSAVRAEAAAERRQLTVAFVDLVDSTALATCLDLEELREALGTFQRTIAEVVVRFGGRVVNFQGDGVLACFGWPDAHEDDAERAVRAGLAAVEAVVQLRLPCGTGPLACRVGIATGIVVVAEPTSGLEVFGETPHLAARLLAMGPPGAVVVADSTRRLLGALFAFESLGRRLPKGFAEPIDVWRVADDGAAENRFEALRGVGLTPLLGRRRELGLLLDRWRLAREGEGQVVLVSGEAGIGKSRLVRGLRERLVDDRHTPIALYCSPHHVNTALHPMLRLLERATDLRRTDPPERQLDALEAMLALATDREREHAPLLADLLGIPDIGRYPRQDALTPQRKKERTFQALLDQLDGLAARGPVLVLYDDVHWADPTTLELLGLVVERVPLRRVLVVVTFRPEFAPPWIGHRHVTTQSLGRLDRVPAAALIAELAGGGEAALPRDAVERILDRADGVPLFLEELTRAVLASTMVQGAETAVPATLQGSLLARLDRLPDAKEVAQLGAVIGREFPRDLLAAVTTMPEAEIQRGLERLVGAGLLHRSTQGNPETYAFKHALVRDAAYESLLKSRRRELHASIAHTLARAFPRETAEEPELLAHHFTEAGLAGSAVDHWRRAGERAVQRYANAEAIGHFRQALRLLVDLPAGLDRDRTELALQTGLGGPLIASKGYSAPEVRAAYARARELCRGMGNTPALFPILLGLCLFYLGKPDLPASRSLAAQCLTAARGTADDDLLLEACGVAGTASMYGGRLVTARTLLERGFALYRPERHGAHAARYGQDPLGTLAFVARTHALLGRPDLARRRSEVLLALTGDPAAQPNSLAAMRAHSAQLHLLLRDAPVALRHAEELVTLASREDLPLWLGLGRMYRGAALVEAGLSGGDRSQIADGIAEGLGGMATYRATGAGLDVPTCLCWFAAGYARLGEAEAASRLLDEARRVIAETGEAYLAAELHRVAGELNLLPERLDTAGAEACLRDALATARRQGAKLLELRAAVSLARLWRTQGAGERIPELLLPLCASFPDDASCRDQTEARAMLGTWPST